VRVGQPNSKPTKNKKIRNQILFIKKIDNFDPKIINCKLIAIDHLCQLIAAGSRQGTAGFSR
jgi:hypothetical protein